MYGNHLKQSMDQTGKVANPARGQLNRGKCVFPCPRSRLRIWSRESGLTVSSLVSPLILQTQAESDWLVLTHGISPAFRDGVHIYRQPPSGQSLLEFISSISSSSNSSRLHYHLLLYHAIAATVQYSTVQYSTVQYNTELLLCLRYVSMVITYCRVWINRVRLPILLVVS